jgi:hypothetical protein
MVLTGAIVHLWRSLRLQVVAECIQAAEQLDVLRGLGSESGQGYFFSRTLPAADLEAYLARHLASPGPCRGSLGSRHALAPMFGVSASNCLVKAPAGKDPLDSSVAGRSPRTGVASRLLCVVSRGVTRAVPASLRRAQNSASRSMCHHCDLGWRRALCSVRLLGRRTARQIRRRGWALRRGQGRNLCAEHRRLVRSATMRAGPAAEAPSAAAMTRRWAVAQGHTRQEKPPPQRAGQ